MDWFLKLFEPFRRKVLSPFFAKVISPFFQKVLKPAGLFVWKPFKTYVVAPLDKRFGDFFRKYIWHPLLKVFDRLRILLPRKADSEEVRWLKILVYSGIGVVFLMFLIAGMFFMFNLRGAELVTVPDVRNIELAQGLVHLQERELYPRVILKRHQDPAMRGFIIHQDPEPGKIVKAGKRVTLQVSIGTEIERVEDYRGRLVSDVRQRLEGLSQAYHIPMSIKEPIIQRDSSEAPGTVLDQDPKPDTPITGPVQLTLVVSRGPGLRQIKMEDYSGRKIADAIRGLAEANLAFTFSVREASASEAPGTVVAQEPVPGATVSEFTRVMLTAVRPARLAEAMVFGIFEYSLPEYPAPVDLEVAVLDKDGNRTPLFGCKHPGGKISFPFELRNDSTLVLSVFGKELVSRSVLQ